MRTVPFGTLRSPGMSARAAAAFLVQAALLAGCSSSTTPLSPANPVVNATSGSGQTGTVGSTLATPVLVTVISSTGSPVAGATISFVGSGGTTVNDSLVTTNSAGQASVTVTLGHIPGPDTVTATDVVVGQTALFTETATTGPAAALVIYAGNNQTAAHGTLLTTPLSVLVHDMYGNIVTGSTVNWAATAGVLGALTSVADSSGRAQVTLTLPGVAGTDSVTATLPGGVSPVVFTEIGN